MPDYDLGTARGTIHLDASSLGRASAAFATLGRSLLGFSAVAVGGFAYVVKQAADFEKVLSAVKAVTNATDSQMDQLSDTALRLATNSAFGAEAIAGAFEDLGKAGISVEQILGGAAEATVRLAEAAGDELPGGITQGAEIIANALKTFEVGADQAGHFADVLVAAAASSTLSVDDIAVSMRYAGPIANQLGLTIDDLATSLAILGDRGIKGSTAGTSLRGVLLSLSPSSGKAKEAMKELGLITADGTNKFFDMNGALKPLPEVMQILGDATKDLSEEQKINAFNTIFQRRAMNAALILAEQGAAGFNTYADAIAGLNAADIAATKLDNLSGDMTILRNAIDSLVISVGLEFQDMLRGWVQGLTGVVQWLSRLDPQLLANALKIIAIGGAIAGVLGTFSLMISGVITMYRNFVLLKEGISLVIGAVRLLTVSFLTNPLFLFVAAIAAIGFALYKLYQQGGAVTEFIDGIIAAITPAIEAVQRFASNFVEQIGNMIDVFQSGDDVVSGFAEVLDSMLGNTGNLISPITTLITGFQDFFTVLTTGFTNDEGGTWFERLAFTIRAAVKEVIKFGTAIANIVIPVLEILAQGLQRAFQVVTAEVIPFAQETFGEFVRFVVEIMPQLLEAVTHVFNAISVVIEYTVGFILAVIRQVINVIMALWRAWHDDLENIVGTIWNAIQETIENTMQFVQGVIQTVLAIINGDWGKAWEGIKDIVGAVWDQIGNIISTAVGLIRAIFTGFISTIIEIWQGLWDKLRGVLVAAGNAIVDFISVKIRDMVNLFIGLPNKITGAIGDLSGKINSFFKAAFLRGYEAVQGVAGDIFAFVGKIPGKIIEALGNIKDLLFNAGKEIVKGLLRGIESMVGAAKDSIGKVTGAIGKFIPGSPVKEGPLTVLNNGKAGKLIVDMLTGGIRDNLSAIARTMSAIQSPLAPLSAAGVNSGSSPIVQLNFSGPYGPDFEQEMRSAVSDPTLLNDLTRAIRAGSR